MPDSSQLIRTGISHLENGAWETALCFFDQAIALRKEKDWENQPLRAWALAAAWINRADALRATGRFTHAIVSLQDAIRSMDFVPLAKHPSYPDRLILSHIKLAACQADISLFSESIHSYQTAQKLLQTWGTATTPNRHFLTAMLHTNRAQLHLTQKDPIAAWLDATAALDSLHRIEKNHSATPAAIHARGVLCQALAHLLEQPGGASLENDWISRATNAAEEALTLARSSNYHGEWLSDLILYCAKIYRICQPHLFSQFLYETLPPDSPLTRNPDLLQKITIELFLARSELVNRVLERPNDTNFVTQETETLQKLQLAETYLHSHPAASLKSHSHDNRHAPLQ
ncbi:MAG: hypothetical protein ACSHX7_09775 [Luteolibacter sp.]